MIMIGLTMVAEVEAIEAPEIIEITQVERKQKTVKNKAVRGVERVETQELDNVFIENYVSDSPLVNYLDKFEGKKGKLALAIAGNESLFGTYQPARENYNAWGYLCYRNGQGLNCGWDSWEYSIDRYLELADHYLEMFDGSKESLMLIQDSGYHPVDNETQELWANNILWFYEQL